MERDNIAAEDRHAPTARASPAFNPRGTGGNAEGVPKLDWDSTLNPVEVRQRFEMLAGRVKRTKDQYWSNFETFADSVGLWTMDRRQLKSKAKELLVPYLNTIGDRNRIYVASRIKKVWRKGLDLPWPVEGDELATPAKPRRIKAPRPAAVEPWVHAARNEKDPYERSWFLVELNHGLRPIDQQAEMRRKDILYNEATGEPLGFHGDASELGFKRDSDLITPFSGEEVDALKAWLAVHPDGSEEARIWPRRYRDGRITQQRTTEPVLTAMRRRFARRWHLTWLTSKDMRHFVRTVLNRSGMPAVERNYWQGHAPDLSSMDERYGDMTSEDILESQRRFLPNGVAGTFLAAEKTDEAPAELVQIYKQLRARTIDESDAVKAMKDLVRQQEKILVR